MTYEDIKVYFTVEEHLKKVVSNDCGGWNEDTVDIVRFSLKDDLVHIQYRTLIDDYNGVWYNHYLDIPVNKFCAR